MHRHHHLLVMTIIVVHGLTGANAAHGGVIESVGTPKGKTRSKA